MGLKKYNTQFTLSQQTSKSTPKLKIRMRRKERGERKSGQTGEHRWKTPKKQRRKIHLEPLSRTASHPFSIFISLSLSPLYPPPFSHKSSSFSSLPHPISVNPLWITKAVQRREEEKKKNFRERREELKGWDEGRGGAQLVRAVGGAASETGGADAPFPDTHHPRPRPRLRHPHHALQP